MTPMKALLVSLTLLTAVAASAQSAQPSLAPPPGQPTGTAPPTGTEFQAPNEHYRGRRGTLVVVEREDLEARLANMEKLLGEAFERSNRGQGRGKLRDAYAELNDIRQVLANAPDVRGYYPQPAPTPPPPPAYQPIGDGRLQRLMNAMSREPFAEDKMNILEEASQGNYFLVSQVLQVLPQFQFSKDRLQAVRVLWSRVLDRQNANQLYGAFQFPNDKAELKQIISG